MSERKSSRRALILTIVIIVLVIVLFRLNNSELPQETMHSPDSVTAPATPASADTMEQHFLQAEARFEAGDRKSAAEEIRKSALALKPSVQLIPEEVEALQATREGLSRLADDIENGTITSINRLRKSFANVYLYFSTMYQKKAVQSWAQKNYAQAGQELEETSDNLKHAARWAGDRVESGFERLIQNSRDLASRLKSGIARTSDKIGQEISAVGVEIHTISKKNESEK
ncbi:MAG: hypothetical protein ACOY90_06275 [Candidatus Zhuqueibacterota bacterium]